MSVLTYTLQFFDGATYAGSFLAANWISNTSYTFEGVGEAARANPISGFDANGATTVNAGSLTVGGSIGSIASLTGTMAVVVAAGRWFSLLATGQTAPLTISDSGTVTLGDPAQVAASLTGAGTVVVAGGRVSVAVGSFAGTISSEPATGTEYVAGGVLGPRVSAYGVVVSTDPIAVDLRCANGTLPELLTDQRMGSTASFSYTST